MPELFARGQSKGALIAVTRPLALLIALVGCAPSFASDPPDPRRLMHLLRYVSKDYAHVAAGKQADEQVEQQGFLKEARRQLAMLPDLPERAPIEAGIGEVSALVARWGTPAEVSGKLENVIGVVAQVYPAKLAPPAQVSMEAGRAVYTKCCANCHAADGRCETPAAKDMDPKPSKFDAGAFADTSPAIVFDTITYGVTGTPMPSYEAVLPVQDRWNMAFYVFSLRGDKVGTAPATVPGLAELATLTDGQLERWLIEKGVAGAESVGARQAIRCAPPR